MKITVNGEAVTLEAGVSVAALLALRQVKMPEMVSVELNGTILDRGAFSGTILQENDTVEFLYFMGGGAR